MRRGGWRVLPIGVLIVGVSSPGLAGAMYRNDSGAVARAVRVEFSEPAGITSTYPSFPECDPHGPSTVIVLGGGEVPAGGWLPFSWRPDTARVVKVEWLTRSVLLPCPPLPGTWVGGRASRQGLENPLEMRFCGTTLGANYGTNVVNVAILPDEYFRWLREMHVNWVGIVVELTVDDSTDSTVEIAGQNIPGLEAGLSEEELTRLVQKLRSYGFNVYLHLTFNGGPAAPAGKRVRNWTVGDPYAYEYDRDVSREHWPWDPQHPLHKEFLAEFFRTYTEQLVSRARFAEEHGVGLMALGAELDNLFRTRPRGSRYPPEVSTELRAMVDAVRAVYSGLLSYDCLWHRFVQPRSWGIPWFQCLWRDLDLVGISAYFPLVDRVEGGVPTVEFLEKQWVHLFEDFLMPLAELYPDKPILFTEFGYNDPPSTSSDPVAGEHTPKVFVDRDGNGLDDGEEEQANILEAFSRVVERYPFLRGCFLWNHMIALHAEWARSFGGALRGLGVRGKLAAPVVKAWYTRWNPSLPDLPPPAEPSAPGPLRAYAWETSPYAVTYPPSPQVHFWPDSSAARNWGLTGSRVQGVKAILLEDVLVVRVDLAEGDRIGNYGYMVAFRALSCALYLVLRPDEYRASVDVGCPDWRELGLLYGDAFEQSATSVAPVVPLGMFSDVFPVGTLAGSRVDMHLEYVYVDNGVRKREFFFLPGEGRVHIGR